MFFVSTPFSKKAPIIFAITVFPKRLGLVIQIWEFPDSINGNSSDKINVLSTKYGLCTSLLYNDIFDLLFK